MNWEEPGQHVAAIFTPRYLEISNGWKLAIFGSGECFGWNGLGDLSYAFRKVWGSTTLIWYFGGLMIPPNCVMKQIPYLHLFLERFERIGSSKFDHNNGASP